MCGYPVNTTWLNMLKAGNYTGWPFLTIQNFQNYYLETTETPKGHINQTRKNVCSTKKTTPTINSLVFHRTRIVQQHFFPGKKRDVYTKVYDVRDTIFSNQTGKFTSRYRQGNKYVIVMVEIDSSGILMKPMKCIKDTEMLQANLAHLK